MKKIALIYLVLILQKAQGQNQVFLKAEHVFGPTTNNEIEKIKLPWGNWGKKVLVLYMDGTKQYFHKKDIWGIEKSEKIIRFYDSRTFQLIDTNAVILYQTYSPHSVYYFSKDLVSEVKQLERKEMIRALGDDQLISAYKRSSIVRRYAY